MFDTRSMEYILAIAEEQSLTKAADRLFISQSALSQQLKKLADSGLPPLFTYSGGKMLPTRAGKLYINGVRLILQVHEDALKEIRSPESIWYPPLRIALLNAVQQDFYEQVVPQFKACFPSVLLDIQTLSYRNITEMLQEHKLDMAIYGTVQEQLPAHAIPLKPLEYVAVVPVGSPEQSYRLLPFVMAQPASNHYQLQKLAMDCWGMANPVYCYCNTTLEAVKLVRQGSCCTIVHRSLAADAPGVQIVPGLPPFLVRLVVSCGPMQEASLPQKYMLDLLRQTFA